MTELETLRRHAEAVMGTVFSLAVTGGSAEALDEACGFLHEADWVFSPWLEDSWISRIRRRQVGIWQAPAVVREVEDLCLEALRLTRGWFDPWRQRGGFDPTGLVKGWATERAAELLRRSGAVAAMVNGAGDIACFGRPNPHRPWRVGVEDPWDPKRVALVLEGWPAVATSGTYRQSSHLIDPASGRTTTAARAATVVGPRLWLADALATAAAAAGPARGIELIEAVEGYELLITAQDGRQACTSGFTIAAEVPAEVVSGEQS